MSKKTFISVKRGLVSDPKHRARIGNRIWTLLHIIDRADYETGTVYDWRDKDEAQDAGLNWRTMQRQRQELSDLGYIDCQLNGRGMDIVIFNWHNPRSYSGKAINPRSKDLKDTEETDAAEYADLCTQSTQESTHTSTQAPNTKLRIPTYRSQVKSHKSDIPANAGTPSKPPLDTRTHRQINY